MLATSDIALRFDPATRRCDLAWGGADFALDATPATPMLVALLSRRRARRDDPLPQPNDDFARPVSLALRGGWAGDALSRTGGRTGSRVWLAESMKRNEATRRFVADAAAEALTEVEEARGVAISLRVEWVAPNTLGLWANAGPSSIALRRSVGGA